MISPSVVVEPGIECVFTQEEIELRQCHLPVVESQRMIHGIGELDGAQRLQLVASGMLGSVQAFSAEEGIEPCTTEWYAWVEDKVNTGDGAGHGPDIGSTEWKYSILFKIGAEGKEGTPSPDSDDWCSFIDSALKTD